MINVAICKRGHRTGFSRTDHILDKITHRALNSLSWPPCLANSPALTVTIRNGLLTATMALLQLAFYLGKVTEINHKDRLTPWFTMLVSL